MTAPGAEMTFEALGFDPAPGDVGQVEELADRLRRVSARLREALAALNAIAEQAGVWQGEAAQAFAEQVDKLPEYLDKAAESTAAAGSALEEWATTLTGLQRQAYELELQARAARLAAEAARDDPAFDLAGVTYYDEETLRVAQRLIDAAITRLTEATDNLNAVYEAAQRLLDQHDELAEGIAELLEQARDLAPDKPGGLGGMLGGAFSALTGAIGDAIGLGMDALDEVGEVLQENANLIAAASRVVGAMGTVVGLAADLEIPGVSQAFGIVAAGLDTVAFDGLLAARMLGADVTNKDLMMAYAGAAADVVGLIPAVQGRAVENVALAVGYGTTLEPVFWPRDDRQWLQSMLPMGRDLMVMENVLTDTVGDVQELFGGEEQ